jgi:hypothetical protein
MSDPLSFDDFTTRIGQSFTMRSEDGACEAVLLECTRGAAYSGSGSFNLLFRAGSDAPRSQGTYLLRRQNFGPAPIFLVPARETPDGVEFHAVFNPSTEDENVP